MYNNIPKLQTGAYIPGLSSSVFQAGLSRDIAKTQGDLRSLGRNIKRKQKSSKLFGSLGKLLGKGGMKFLTKGLMASNPLLGLALNAAGSAGGKYLGAKLGYGKKSKIDNDSELLGSQFKDLSDFESGISKEIAGESVADFGTEFAKGLKSEYGQNIMDSLNPCAPYPVEVTATNAHHPEALCTQVSTLMRPPHSLGGDAATAP